MKLLFVLVITTFSAVSHAQDIPLSDGAVLRSWRLRVIMNDGNSYPICRSSSAEIFLTNAICTKVKPYPYVQSDQVEASFFSKVQCVNISENGEVSLFSSKSILIFDLFECSANQY